MRRLRGLFARRCACDKLHDEIRAAPLEERLRLGRIDKRLSELLTLARAADITLTDVERRLATIEQRHVDAG